MKQDMLGEYNENEIPHGLHLPLHLDERNDAIADVQGNVIANYNSSPSSVHRGFMRRAVEFITRITANEIAVHNGKVYIQSSAKEKDGMLTIVFKAHE